MHQNARFGLQNFQHFPGVKALDPMAEGGVPLPAPSPSAVYGRAQRLRLRSPIPGQLRGECFTALGRMDAPVYRHIDTYPLMFIVSQLLTIGPIVTVQQPWMAWRFCKYM
jgi:hypothetical protein